MGSVAGSLPTTLSLLRHPGDEAGSVDQGGTSDYAMPTTAAGTAGKHPDIQLAQSPTNWSDRDRLILLLSKQQQEPSEMPPIPMPTQPTSPDPLPESNNPTPARSGGPASDALQTAQLNRTQVGASQEASAGDKRPLPRAREEAKDTSPDFVTLMYRLCDSCGGIYTQYNAFDRYYCRDCVQASAESLLNDRRS